MKPIIQEKDVDKMSKNNVLYHDPTSLQNEELLFIYELPPNKRLHKNGRGPQRDIHPKNKKYACHHLS